MDFTHMPQFGWCCGYPWALGVMAVVGAALALRFRRGHSMWGDSVQIGRRKPGPEVCSRVDRAVA
jgi:hypothetical protein